MKACQVLLSGIAGTSLMTLFSYAVSEAENKNFKEPELLAALLKDVLPDKKLALPAGWATHYSLGISWAVVLSGLLQRIKIKPTVKSGLLLGGLSGLTGILIWKSAFKIHRNPPLINYQRFYSHLLLAHLIYSITVTSGNRKIYFKT